MSKLKSVSLLLATLLLAISLAAFAEDQPATPAAGADKSSKPAKKISLVAPWSKLQTLTDEQKQQIADIHAKAAAEIKAIKQREEEQVLALLTAEQKAELEENAAEEKAKRKAKADEKAAAKSEKADKKADGDAGM